MTKTTCRWGILGAAAIARKNWHAIWHSGNGQIAAVASRSLARAEQYIDECQTTVPFVERPRASGYEELLASRDIDAVYIPLPTGLRKEWVIRAAEAGKHVVCEKPCAVNVAELKEILAACRKNNVQFMDGVMFMHSKRLDALRSTLDDGRSIGHVRRIATQFSFLGSDEFAQQNIRVNSQLEPLGCLGDLGWYNLRFTLWVMKYELPERVTGRILSVGRRPDSTAEVPTEFSGELFFPDGVSASFYCSFVTENQQWASVSGTAGSAFVPDFVLPFYGHQVSFELSKPRFVAHGCQFNMEGNGRRVTVHEYSNNAADAQETNLFRHFGNLVLSGRVEASWSEIALKTQQVTNAALESARGDGRPVLLNRD